MMRDLWTLTIPFLEGEHWTVSAQNRTYQTTLFHNPFSNNHLEIWSEIPPPPLIGNKQITNCPTEEDSGHIAEAGFELTGSQDGLLIEMLHPRGMCVTFFGHVCVTLSLPFRYRLAVRRQFREVLQKNVNSNSRLRLRGLRIEIWRWLCSSIYMTSE